MSTDSELPPSSDEPPDRNCTPAGRCEISLQNPCGYPEAGARRHRAWLTPLVAELAPASTSFAVRFVSDREMRRLNAAYRRQDTTTDVLSFPDAGDDDPRGSERHLGDVVISVPAARRQAAARPDGRARELRVLMLHGLLHCLGYDHETDDGTMERLEARLRRRWVDHG